MDHLSSQERAPDEQKEESKKLKAIIERHKTLIPKVQETLVKTECYWKCYSYGDDLIPIFEFIDDLRNRSVWQQIYFEGELKINFILQDLSRRSSAPAVR